jgi:tetratricopeptide (TPR) repeat protein
VPTRWEAEHRHAAHYAGLLQELQEAYQAGHHDAAVSRFEQDWGQVRKGQAWAGQELDRGGEGRSLVELYCVFGHELLRLRRPPSELIHWLEPTLSIVSESGDPPGVLVETLNIRGMAAYDEGKIGEALLFYQRALARLSEDTADDDPEYVARMRGGILRNIAAGYQRIGRFEEAAAGYEESLAIARHRGDRHEESSILGNLGIAYAEHDDNDRAVSYYRQALDIATEIHDESERDLWLGNLGNSYISLGRRQDGVDHLEEALTIARERRNRVEEGVRLGALGTAYLDLEQADRAREYIEEALAIAREMGNAHSEAVQLHRLGLLHFRLGHNDEAVSCLARAAERFEALGLAPLADRAAENLHVAREHQIDELCNLGFAEQAAGRLDLAERHFLEVVKIDSQLDDINLRARHILNLADVHHLRGELDAASECYVEALAMLGPLEDRELAAKALANLGTIDAHRGRPAAVREHYQQASEAFAALGLADLVERVQQDLADLGEG